MYRIGLSTTEKEINEELFRAYASGGIGQMELAMDAPRWYEIDFRKIGKWAGEYGVNLWSMHLPFGYGAGTPFDPSEPDFCNETVQRHGEFMKKGADIGIDKFVIHASLENIDDDHRRMRMDCAKESLARLAQTARECGVTVAVEALPRTCLGRISEEMAELTGVDDSLRVCFDTNHIMLEDNADYIRKVGDKIITLHVSDFDYIRERHCFQARARLTGGEFLTPYPTLATGECGCTRWLSKLRGPSFARGILCLRISSETPVRFSQERHPL